MKNIFLTLTGFQITWTFCIFGEYYNIPFIGIIVGLIYLCIFFYFISYKIRALKICLIFSIIGYIFDSSLGYIQLFNIKSSIMLGYLPIWFLVLWPSFTTLFVKVLPFLFFSPHAYAEKRGRLLPCMRQNATAAAAAATPLTRLRGSCPFPLLRAPRRTWSR